MALLSIFSCNWRKGGWRWPLFPAWLLGLMPRRAITIISQNIRKKNPTPTNTHLLPLSTDTLMLRSLTSSLNNIIPAHTHKTSGEVFFVFFFPPLQLTVKSIKLNVNTSLENVGLWILCYSNNYDFNLWAR